MNSSDWIALTAIIVGAALSAFTLVWQTRAENRRTGVRDSQQRLATQVADVLVSAHDFQNSFASFAYHCPRSGGRFGPRGSDPGTWETISEEEAKVHDEAATEALDEMAQLKQTMERELVLLSLYAPREVVDSLRAVANTFVALFDISPSTMFSGTFVEESEAAMKANYDRAVETVRKTLGVPW